MTDLRLEPPRWDAAGDARVVWRLRWLLIANVAAAMWYFGWLLHPDRVGHAWLYTALICAELFNLVQASGFWWTCGSQRTRRSRRPLGRWDEATTEVDVFIPTYGEPLSVVEPTVAAAVRLRGAVVHVYLLDDGRDPAKEAMAAHYGATYVTRGDRVGAKAGNINHALGRTTSEFVVVFDSDHVPNERFLERTLGAFADERVAFVQTPQYYANGYEGGVASAAWAQQALFFGAIGRGKDALDSMFCCGTNVVFRRAALEAVGGFPQRSVTEDFELSLCLHERGWRSVYVPEVLASGLGPEDMASYVGQQLRWARGCFGALPRIIASRLPLRQRVQYMLSSLFFLTGWTFLVYISLPAIRLVLGLQPISVASADQFLLHFLPYFSLALFSVALAGAGTYTFSAFALLEASFWVHLAASLRAMLRRPGTFTVTPKEGRAGRQPRAVLPALVAIGVLVAAATVGLVRDAGPGTLNNVAFASLHIGILLAGCWSALRGRRAPARDVPSELEGIRRILVGDRR